MHISLVGLCYLPPVTPLHGTPSCIGAEAMIDRKYMYLSKRMHIHLANRFHKLHCMPSPTARYGRCVRGSFCIRIKVCSIHLSSPPSYQQHHTIRERTGDCSCPLSLLLTLVVHVLSITASGTHLACLLAPCITSVHRCWLGVPKIQYNT